ncbi:probable RNA-binding protein 46 [Tetranychus urticae]|uniref:RRM domain-containing protein n=1 Tax=Tetranychus urticae TaxID=32264 RepID=T1KPE9_TETUR|nr:probable RNA-binding protein 46 [Tetranychus urticae]
MDAKPNLTDDNNLNQRLYELMERTGYNIILANGQRRFGPPPNWMSGEPPRGSEVFIARIPRSFSELDILPIFERMGKVYMLRMMLNFSTTNRGFAFLKYTSPSMAERAVQELNNYEVEEITKEGIRKVKLGVVRSFDRNALSMHPIPVKISLHDVLDLLYGNDIDDSCLVAVKKELLSDANYKVIIEFDEHRSAALARRKLLPLRNRWGGHLVIDWYPPEPKQSKATPNNSRIVRRFNKIFHA